MMIIRCQFKTFPGFVINSFSGRFKKERVIHYHSGGNGKMKKLILAGSIFSELLFLMTPCVDSIQLQNQKSTEIQKMELVPHSLFYIAFGDFYVEGNDIRGDATILFWVCMKYFIIPQPHIEFNTRFGAPIVTDFYDYYKIMYTNNIIFIYAIWR